MCTGSINDIDTLCVGSVKRITQARRDPKKGNFHFGRGAPVTSRKFAYIYIYIYIYIWYPAPKRKQHKKHSTTFLKRSLCQWKCCTTSQYVVRNNNYVLQWIKIEQTGKPKKKGEKKTKQKKRQSGHGGGGMAFDCSACLAFFGQ